MKDKIRRLLFFWTLREFRKKGRLISRGARCSIATTSQCPYRCDYCPSFIYGEPKKYEECTWQEWRVFLERFPIWISAVYITGGEPSMYFDIVPLTNYLIESGHHVILQTNLFKAESFIGIKPHHRLIFMATYQEKQEQKLNRGNKFYENAELLRGNGFLIITQQVGAVNKKHTRVKEYFTKKWFIESDNTIMFEPSTPRSLRIWMGSVNMYKK